MEQSDAQNTMPFLGSWKLKSAEVTNAEGQVSQPYGPNPKGMIIYTDTGNFSAQVVNPDRPQFESGDQLKGTPEEIEANYKGFVSYFGSFEYDSENGFVLHHVECSLFPNWEGKPQKRFIEISGKELKIKYAANKMGW